MSNKQENKYMPIYILSHGMGQNVPWGGTKCPMGWDKFFPTKELFQTLFLLLLMLVVGDGKVWGQAPITPTPYTIDNGNIVVSESEKNLYLIQTNQFESFYITPKDGSNLNTVNLPHTSMLWYFLEAEYDAVNNIHYYYIVNNNTGKYIYNTDYTKNDNNGRQIKLGDLDPDASDKFKFYLIENGTTGYYYIYIKQNNRQWLGLNKQGGNVLSTYGIRLTNAQYIDNINSRWKFVPYDGISLNWPNPPFTVSTDLERHYYKIRNKKADSYYISTNPNTNKVTYSSAESNEMVWYFKEASSEGLMKYYYVINPAAGNKYMYYDGTVTNGSDQSNAVSIKDINDANAVADRFLFVIVQAAAVINNSDDPDNGYYMIVPKLLIGNLWSSNSLGTKSPSNGSNMGIIAGRVNDANAYPHWSFETLWGDPVVTCDENGTITITGEDGAAFYYTTDGNTVPTTANSQYNANSKPTVSGGITTIKVRAIANGKSPSRVITQKIVYVPNQTFASSTYDGTAQTPDVIVGETTINPDEYNINYKLGGTDVTECKDAGTYTVTITDKVGGEYIVYGSGSFTINQKALTITADAKSKTYGDADPALTYTSEGLFEGDAFTGALSRVSGETVGTYAINHGNLSAGGNYNISYTGANLTISKKDLTITADSDSKEYDGTALIKNSYTITNNTSLATGDAITSITINGSQTTRGSSENVPSAAVIKNNNGNGVDVTACYDITYESGTLSVTGRVITITADSDSKEYDGMALTNDSYSYDGTLFSGDAITSVTVTGSQTVAGSSNNVPSAAVIKNGQTNVTANYDFNYVNGTLEVTKKALTITAKPKTITYGEAPDNAGVTYSGFVNSESESVLGGTLAYDYSYVQYGDVGNTYTITPKGLSSTNYNFTYQNGTLTVNPKEVGIDWTNTELTYNGSEQAPTATATGLVNNDGIVVSITGAATNAGSYTATVSSLTGDKKDNYLLPEDLTQDFTIAPKSLGNGNQPADGISISLTTEGELSAVQDGSTTLVENTDYSYTTDQTGDDKTVIVTGMGNYTGSVKSFYVNPVFTDPDGQGSSQAAAVYKSSRDLAKPTGITPYIVRKVNPSIGTMVISPLDYIPEDVPVLLLSDAEAAGFVASPKDESTPDITDGTKNSNQLKVAPEEGVAVEAAQVYMFYKGEFVLTKKGKVTEGKFFLYNPNFTATPGEQSNNSRGILQMVIDDDVTEVDDVRGKTEEVRDSKWYTLEGQRLSGQPTKSGIYIQKGQKMYIKRK